MGLRVTPENLVPLRALTPHFVFGLLCLIAAPALLFLAEEPFASGFYRHPRVLAFVHLYVLGWGTAIALGALQQMSAVVFGTVLHSPRLGLRAFVPFALGVLSLVAGFLTLARPALFLGALLVPLGVLFTLANIAFTMRSARPTRQGTLVRPYVQSAMVYLTVAVLAGGALAVNLATGWLGSGWNVAFPAHVGVGVGGWFLMLVIGISYHLLPFFGLVEKKRPPRWPGLVRGLLHAGIGLGITGALLAGAQLHPVGRGAAAASAAAVALAILLFLWEERELFAPRAPERLHPLVGYVRAAHGYLLALALVLLSAAVWPAAPGHGANGRPLVVIGVLAAGGWLTNTILGYLHRILPFFIWHNKYWGRGREPGVPAFRAMVNNRVAWLGLVLYNAGLLALLAWLLGVSAPLTAALILLSAGSFVAAVNLLRIWFR